MIPEAAVEAAGEFLPPVWTSNPVYRAELVAALEAARPHLLAEAVTKPLMHHCEPWQIQVNGSGTFRYCAACGEPQP